MVNEEDNYWAHLPSFVISNSVKQYDGGYLRSCDLYQVIKHFCKKKRINDYVYKDAGQKNVLFLIELAPTRVRAVMDKNMAAMDIM